MSIDRDLIKLNSAMTQLMRAIRSVDESSGVGRARLSALAVLHFGGPCSPTELAKQEMVSRVTMHHIIVGLENDGLVKRTPDALDARRQSIALTRQGKATITKAHTARIEFLRTLADKTAAGELKIAANVLSDLRDSAKAEDTSSKRVEQRLR